MKAMILCAGYGTRLGSLTEDTPKPMLPIAGRPMLEYILSNLSRRGFNEIAINLHFKPDIIQNYFQDGSEWGVDLVYSHEPELLGTAGGLKKMEPFFCGEDFFLVHYGDVMTDQDFSGMLDFHKTNAALGTLLVHKRARSNSIVEMDALGRISMFLERPGVEKHPPLNDFWVNSGVSILSPEIFRWIPESGSCDLPRDVFPGLVPSGRLFGFPLSGYRCAVDSPERYKEAQEAISGGACRISIERKGAR